MLIWVIDWCTLILLGQCVNTIIRLIISMGSRLIEVWLHRLVALNLLLCNIELRWQLVFVGICSFLLHQLIFNLNELIDLNEMILVLLCINIGRTSIAHDQIFNDVIYLIKNLPMLSIIFIVVLGWLRLLWSLVLILIKYKNIVLYLNLWIGLLYWLLLEFISLLILLFLDKLLFFSQLLYKIHSLGFLSNWLIFCHEPIITQWRCWLNLLFVVILKDLVALIVVNLKFLHLTSEHFKLVAFIRCIISIFVAGIS